MLQTWYLSAVYAAVNNGSWYTLHTHADHANLHNYISTLISFLSTDVFICGINVHCMQSVNVTSHGSCVARYLCSSTRWHDSTQHVSVSILVSVSSVCSWLRVLAVMTTAHYQQHSASPSCPLYWHWSHDDVIVDTQRCIAAIIMHCTTSLFTHLLTYLLAYTEISSGNIRT